MGFFDKIKQGLKKTSDAVNHSLDSVFAAFVKVDDDLLEELEEALILSDVGASTAAKIVAEVEKRAKLRKTTTANELRDLLREVLTDNMLDNQPLEYARASRQLFWLSASTVSARRPRSASWRPAMSMRVKR